jgi:FkbM family methyltransferase
MQPKGGRVLALEPDPASCRVLEANIDLNHLGETVICDQRAASREGGECQLEQHGTQSRLIAGHRIAGPAVSVRMAPLTQILQERQIVRVDLLQIDVEGAELEVLRGFPWGAVSVGWILVELHPYAWASFGYTGREFEKFLQSHHLRCIDCYLREVDLHDSEYIGPTRLLPSHA